MAKQKVLVTSNCNIECSLEVSYELMMSNKLNIAHGGRNEAEHNLVINLEVYNRPKLACWVF